MSAPNDTRVSLTFETVAWAFLAAFVAHVQYVAWWRALLFASVYTTTAVIVSFAVQAIRARNWKVRA